MKKIFIILFLFLSCTALATNYYVKNGGNDGAAGTSDATAWATIAKVNASSYNPGDNVLFKRGDTWRITTADGYLNTKSGTSAGNVIYSSYGTGVKPLFLGSKEENSTDDWVDQGGNLWRNSDASFDLRYGPGNLIFNSEASSGYRVFTTPTVQGRWSWDYTNHWITLYSVGNPATYYSDIEVALSIYPGIINVTNDRSYITIDGFDVRYGAWLGISMSSGANNINIRNNNVTWIGGSSASEGSSTRLGNGIQLYGNGVNILIENNFVENIYDSGISPQWWSASTLTITNFRVQNNIISKCDLTSFEMVWSVPNGMINGFYFENNTCVNAGKGWAIAQRTSSTTSAGNNIRAADGSTITFQNCYIRNNIFYQR